MTVDEIAHLTAGHAYNTLDDYRLQPENGNLPQRLAGLPATLMGAPLPATDSPAWRHADVWNYGHAFFYGQATPTAMLLFTGRGMIAVFSAATGLLIFFWSHALFGWRGGFLSLALFAFCPAFLAHGALATSDVVMTFFFLASVGAWWRHLERPGGAGAALSAITFGLACVAKFSAVLLLPIFIIIAAVWLFGRVRTAGWQPSLTRLARSAGVHAVVAWAAIWLFFGFRFSAFAPDLAVGASYNRDWNWLISDLGWPGSVILRLQQWKALPDAFLYGFTFVYQFAKQRGAFLSGEHSIHGWVRFFPYAFLVKTTLPFLLILAIGAVAGTRRLWAEDGRAMWTRLRPFTPLAVLFGVYWIASLTSSLNIGHRHILPTYPVLFIAAGWFGRHLDFRHPIPTLCIAGLVFWHIGESLRIRPHYLAYFNQLVGGPKNGWRHLVDSSLDWGQDLPTLKRWLDVHARGEEVFLSYFGTGDPAYEGIRATMLPTLPEVGPPRRWHALSAGVYAISATMLQHVYSPFRGEWTMARETEYQSLRALAPRLLSFQHDPDQRAEMLREAPSEYWTIAWKRYELLRFARLCHWLRIRDPDAHAGYSILIYRVTAADITAATAGSLSEWAALIERSITARSERQAAPL